MSEHSEGPPRGEHSDTSGWPPIPARAWIAAAVVVVVTGGLIAGSLFTEYRHSGTAGYVGVKACVESDCHEDQHETWSKTKMAKAFDVLRPGEKADEKKLGELDPEKDYTHDAKCLKCHTTGYGLVGGFVSIEETPDLAGVTCEACHGPGGVYVADKTMLGHDVAPKGGEPEGRVVYPPTAVACKKCHNADSPFVGDDYEFKYDERVEKGTHEHHELKYGKKAGE